MFTVEHEEDYTTVVTLDQNNDYSDVEVIFDEVDVVIRQFSDQRDSYDLINLSHQQFKDIIAAQSAAEGAYYAN